MAGVTNLPDTDRLLFNVLLTLGTAGLTDDGVTRGRFILILEDIVFLLAIIVGGFGVAVLLSNIDNDFLLASSDIVTLLPLAVCSSEGFNILVGFKLSVAYAFMVLLMVLFIVLLMVLLMVLLGVSCNMAIDLSLASSEMVTLVPLAVCKSDGFIVISVFVLVYVLVLALVLVLIFVFIVVGVSCSIDMDFLLASSDITTCPPLAVCRSDGLFEDVIATTDVGVS
jgi:hypothetical protein